jgi:hypothetical protein
MDRPPTGNEKKIWGCRSKFVRILLIAFSYAPMLSTQAFRWTPIAKEMSRRGHEIYVVAGWEPGSIRRECEDGVKVYRVGGQIIERLRRIYNGKKDEAQSQPIIGHSHNVFKRSSLGVFKRIHDVSWKRLYWPDAHCTWSIPAIWQAREILHRRKIDALITVAFPFTSHIVGLALRCQNAALRWLCDMSDPFSYLEPTPPNNVRLYSSLNSAAERKVFGRADVVAVTCDDTMRRYSALYPEWRTKFAVVPHLLSVESGRTLPSETSVLNGQPQKKRLVFTGILDGRIRNPRPLLDACKRISDRGLIAGLQVHLYGMIRDCDAVFEEYLGSHNKWLFVHGVVDKQTADQAIKDADVLVNIGNRYQCQLPSKLVDYGNEGKPILNMIGCPSDLSIEALKDYRAALHLVCMGESLAEPQIEEMEKFLVRQNALPKEEVNAWVQKFKLSSIVTMYEQLIG